MNSNFFNGFEKKATIAIKGQNSGLDSKGLHPSTMITTKSAFKPNPLPTPVASKINPQENSEPIIPATVKAPKAKPPKIKRMKL